MAAMIRLSNSKTHTKQDFIPLDPQNVRMYVCGPTVYDRAHLGNARPVVVFDTLYRLFRQVFGVNHVSYVRNFTDIDDKINARSRESGRDIADITTETAQWYLDDMDALGALPPDHMPRATHYVPHMIAMIEKLITGGHAYEAQNHVLFAVESYADYGKLSGRSSEDMVAGARVEIAPYKRNPIDFVLWKPSDANTPGWQSPWGRGRPGWHIECSAMVHDFFGENFDLHGGGNDLLFPHHENEIAQSCCAHPNSTFARHWMHNEMLLVEGRKMSKSLGNFFTVRDLLDQGVAGEIIRFVFLQTHYSKPMDWTEQKASEAQETLRKWHMATAEIPAGGGGCTDNIDARVFDRLCDDLNTAGALARLHELFKAGRFDVLKASAQMVGLLDDGQDWWQKKAVGADAQALIDALLTKRAIAKKDRDFATADAIRDRLLAVGVEIQDKPGGVSLGIAGPRFNPSRLI